MMIYFCKVIVMPYTYALYVCLPLSMYVCVGAIVVVCVTDILIAYHGVQSYVVIFEPLLDLSNVQ